MPPFDRIQIPTFEMSLIEARHYLATRRDEMPAEIAHALAAAVPPELPKEGEVWLYGGSECVIGPSKWGRVMVRKKDNGEVWLPDAAAVANGWVKVR